MTHVIFGFSSERLLDVVRVLSFEIIEELARPAEVAGVTGRYLGDVRADG